MRYRPWIVLTAVVVAVSRCGGSGGSYGSGPNNNPGGSTGSTSKQIAVRNNVFDPAATTVPVGSSVTWTWAQGSDIHNVTFDDGPKSADQSTGGYTRVFDKAGAYPYHCTRHGGMTGSVTVQ